MNLMDMTEADFDAAHDAHFMTPRRAPFYGLAYQGRHDDRPWRQQSQEKPTDGAHAATEHGHKDAEDQLPEGGLIALLWVMVAAAGGLAVLVLWGAR